MDNNISEGLKKELEKLFASKFFFKEPSDNKVILYTITYLLLIILGSIFRMEIVSAFLIVFPLIYIVGAKGLKLYLPLVVVGIGILAFLSSITMLFWVTLHMAVAYIIYYMIVSRYSKIILVIAVPTFLFLAISIYIFVQLKTGVISINKEAVLDFINNNANTILASNQSIDRSVILSNFEAMQRTFPVTLFIVLALYGLGLCNYVLSALAREYVVIPAFPRLELVMVSTPMGYIYITLTIIALLVGMQVGDSSYNFWSLVLDNAVSIFSLLFVLNGLFTTFFFAEVSRMPKVSKVFLVVFAFIFSPIFELLGFVDCLFKLRESYITMRKG